MAISKTTGNALALIKKGGVTRQDVMIDSDVIAQNVTPQLHAGVVVQQSLKSGTSVLKGTPVDIVLAVTDKLPIKVIKDLQPVWIERNPLIGDVAVKVQNDPDILGILDKSGGDPAVLTQQERGQVVEFAQKQFNVTINVEDTAGIGGALQAMGGAYQLSNSIE